MRPFCKCLSNKLCSKIRYFVQSFLLWLMMFVSKNKWSMEATNSLRKACPNLFCDFNDGIVTKNSKRFFVLSSKDLSFNYLIYFAQLLHPWSLLSRDVVWLTISYEMTIFFGTRKCKIKKDLWDGLLDLFHS